jgi:spore coat protein U-like protein
MKIRTSFRLAALALLTCFCNMPSAHAAQTTTTFSVTATVTATCSVSASTLAFGNYAGNQTDGATTITVTCTNTTPYEVGLNDGVNTPTRRMKDAGSNYLTYDLYTDSGRSTRWGEIGDVGGTSVHGTGDGTPQTLDVYGRIPANQNPPAGNYTDTVTVTLSY